MEDSPLTPAVQPAGRQAVQSADPPAVQPALAGLAPKKRRKRKSAAAVRMRAENQPIARVILDVQAAHLGQPFDYLVPENQSEVAIPGVRVRVRFGQRLVDGFIWERVDHSDTVPERLKFIERVVSPVVLLSDEYRQHIEDIAHLFGGTIANVLRLAVPARVASVEKSRDWAQQSQQSQARWQAQSRLWVGMPEFDSAAGTRDSVQAPAPDGNGAVLPPAAAAARRYLAALTRQELREYENADCIFPPRHCGTAPDDSALDDAIPDDVAPAVPHEIIWSSLPGPHRWAQDCVWALMRALASGMAAVVVLPTHRAVTEVRQQLQRLGFTQYAVMDSADSPQDRYRAFVAVASGVVRCVIGLRAAMYAPVRGRTAFIAVNDNVYQNFDGFAPYANVRGVCQARARLCGGTYVSLGRGRSVDDQFDSQQVQRNQFGAQSDEGQAPSSQGDGSAVCVVRGFEAASDALRPRVQWLTPEALRCLGDPTAGARLPQTAVRVLRSACAKGPVLLLVPSTGYAEVLACAQCHRQARCRRCSGPVHLVLGDGGNQAELPDGRNQDVKNQAVKNQAASPGSGLTATCAWCGTQAADWRCPHCGGSKLRIVKVGAQGIASDVANLIKRVPIIISDPHSPAGTLRNIPNRSSVVIATAGAQPDVEGGQPYQALAICDAWTSLYSQALDAAEDTFVAWADAASLVAPASAGGQVLILGECDPAVSRALMVWDSSLVAAKDNEERRQTCLPPFVSVATLWGSSAAVMGALERIGALDGDLASVSVPQADESVAELPSVMGPIPISSAETEHNRQFDGASDRVRAIVRVPRSKRQVLVDRLKSVVAQHSIARAAGELRFWIDPKNLRNR